MSTKQTERTNYDGPDERPKALRYRDRINAVEEKIVNALPEIADKLIAMAKEGDVAAARYLFDRTAGRPSRLPAPPSIDRTIPYTASDWAADSLERKDRRDQKAAVYMKSIFARQAEAEIEADRTARTIIPSGKASATKGFPGIGSTPSIDAFR
jgi:hypothetical protein